MRVSVVLFYSTTIVGVVNAGTDCQPGFYPTMQSGTLFLPTKLSDTKCITLSVQQKADAKNAVMCYPPDEKSHKLAGSSSTPADPSQDNALPALMCSAGKLTIVTEGSKCSGSAPAAADTQESTGANGDEKCKLEKDTSGLHFTQPKADPVGAGEFVCEGDADTEGGEKVHSGHFKFTAEFDKKKPAAFKFAKGVVLVVEKGTIEGKWDKGSKDKKNNLEDLDDAEYMVADAGSGDGSLAVLTKSGDKPVLLNCKKGKAKKPEEESDSST